MVLVLLMIIKDLIEMADNCSWDRPQFNDEFLHQYVSMFNNNFYKGINDTISDSLNNAIKNYLQTSFSNSRTQGFYNFQSWFQFI